MGNFRIITDTTADLPVNYIMENKLGIMFLPYILDGVTYSPEKGLDYKVFYEKMRSGLMPTTSQVNPEEAKEMFEQYLTETKEILCLSFSSGLSGTYNSARIAAEEVMEEHPDCKIMVIDSKCASLGEGLFVHKAIQMQKEGKSMEEIAEWLESHKLNFVHVFTVDDLNHLYRGGRVSKATAIIGTMANIKPVLHVNDEGLLIPVSKVRGRKKSLHALTDYMEQKMGSFRNENKTVFISHGDAAEDAELVAEAIKERFGIDSFLINHIGPTIGAHAGPGTIALFFMGESR